MTVDLATWLATPARGSYAPQGSTWAYIAEAWLLNVIEEKRPLFFDSDGFDWLAVSLGLATFNEETEEIEGDYDYSAVEAAFAKIAEELVESAWKYQDLVNS